MRVLLIEDDSATAQSIELMLKSESFNVYTTDLGEVTQDRVVVAHLRMNVPAALSLKAAIEGAILLATPPPSEAKN